MTEGIVTLLFVNETAETYAALNVPRSAAPKIADWYGAFYAGDDYKVFINGVEQKLGINGELEPIVIDGTLRYVPLEEPAND